MTYVNAKQLQNSAREKLVASQLIFAQKSPLITTIAYLLHVSMECALKARLLIDYNAQHSGDPSIANEIRRRFFQSKGGHELSSLFEIVSLRRKLKAIGKEELINSDLFYRICHKERPYSLRYHYESISLVYLKEELEFCETLLKVLVPR